MLDKEEKRVDGFSDAEVQHISLYQQVDQYPADDQLREHVAPVVDSRVDHGAHPLGRIHPEKDDTGQEVREKPRARAPPGLRRKDVPFLHLEDCGSGHRG